MTLELPFSQAAASLRSFAFVLVDPLRSYAWGVSLDLLASFVLVWAISRLKSLTLRLSFALALFLCLHTFGGWEREPKELAFSVTVILCLLSLGAHARFLAASRERRRGLFQYASWADYWSCQIVSFFRQVSFEAIAVLSVLVLLSVEALIILKW
jgi:hypothetical protein